MPVAFNEAEGKAYRLNPGSNQWEPTSLARNSSTGEQFALDGDGWVTVSPPNKAPSFEEPVREFFRANLAAKKPAEAPADGKPQPPDVSTMGPDGVKPAKGFMENFEAGFQMSTAGLAARGKLPGLQTPVEADRFERLANAAGMTIGDIPAMVAGAFGGGAAGGAVGSAVPVVGTAAGVLVGSGAGAMALPAALRASMMDAYAKGEVKDFADYWDRVSSIFLEFGKGAVTGGTMAGAGGATRGAMAASGPVMREAAALTAEITTMVTMGRALEGEMPQPNDFIDAAVFLGGVKVATATAGKLRTIYAKTGVKPSEVVEQAQRDPVFKQEVLSKDDAVPTALAGMVEGGTGQPTAKAVKAPKDATISSEVLSKPVEEKVAVAPFEEPKPKAPAEPPAEINRGDAEKAVLDRIATPEAAKKATSWSEIYANYVDDLHPIKQFRDLLTGKEPVLTKDDPYIAARLTRGSAGKADHFLEYGTFDFNNLQRTGKSLKQTLEPVVGDLEGFKAYAVASRAVELANRGIESGVPLAEAKAVVGSQGKPGVVDTDALAQKLGVRVALTSGNPSYRGGVLEVPDLPPAEFKAKFGNAREDVVAHEMGHALLDKWGMTGEIKGQGYEALRAELRDISKKFRPSVWTKAAGHTQKSGELLADGLAVWMTRPEARASMPEFAKLFGSKIGDLERLIPETSGQTAKQKQYAAAFKDLQAYQDSLTRYMRDAGILSKEAFDQMREANKSYVPFYRLMEEDGGKGPGAGLRVRNPVKGIKGSERHILDPIESIVKNTYLYVTLAERNRALVNMAQLAEKAPLGAELMQKVKTPTRLLEVTEPEVAKFLADHGLDANAAEAFSIFRPNRQPLANDEIALFRDGKREVYQVAPEVAAAVNKLDRGTLSLALRIAAIPAKMLRAGVTLTPEFMARNIVRDTATAAILPRYAGIPIYDTLKGLGSVISKDEHYQNWLKSGGANSALVSIDRNYIEQNILKLSKDTNLLDQTWNIVRTPLETLRVVSELVDNATRLGVYRRAMKDPENPSSLMNAGIESREGTLDFQRMGARMQAANAITAFMNVGVQGIDRTVRAFQERPLATTARVAAFITAPSVMLWAANHDDPRWKEIPQWQKDMFWIVMTKDTVYRIPKPFELGVLFGSLPERALDAYFGENPRAFKDFQQTVFEGVMPNYIPTAVQPLIEHWANKSTFTGNPIVPFDVEGELPEYRYQPYTSIVAKKLGQFVAAVPGLGNTSFASPAVLENYARAWSGGMGAYAIQVADQALIRSGAVEDPVKPAATLADLPFVKAFVVRHPTAQAQSIQDFYDRYEQKSQALTTIRKQAQEGNVDAALEIMQAEEHSADLIKLSGVKEALTQQHRFIRMVYNNKDISPEEKRQLIDGVYNGMIETARFGNQIMDDFEKSVKQSKRP